MAWLLYCYCVALMISRVMSPWRHTDTLMHSATHASLHRDARKSGGDANYSALGCLCDLGSEGGRELERKMSERQRNHRRD